MQTGDIVIVSFPYTDLISFKARPFFVVAEIQDNYNDVIVSLISSQVPQQLSAFEIFLQSSSLNNLKAPSVIKVARLATAENNKIMAVIGKLTPSELQTFKIVFKSLVD